MILSKKLYEKNKFKFWWFERSYRKNILFQGVKFFQMMKVSWPLKPYIYSSRFLTVPEFSGNIELLKSFHERKKLEEICPTNALVVTNDLISIDSFKCVLCQRCVEYAPEGIFVNKG